MRFTLGFPILCIALTGCAVIPKPLDDGQLVAYAQDKHERVSLDQEPLSGPVDLYEAMARA